MKKCTYVITYNVGGYGSEEQDVLIRFSTTKQVMDEIDEFRKEMEQKQEMFYFVPLLQFIESRVTDGVQLFFSRNSLNHYHRELSEKELKEPHYKVTLSSGELIECGTPDYICKYLTEFKDGSAVVLTMESVARCSYCGKVHNIQNIRTSPYNEHICLECMDYYKIKECNENE